MIHAFTIVQSYKSGIRCHKISIFSVITGERIKRKEGVRLDSVEKVVKEVKQGSVEEYRHIVQKFQNQIFRYCCHMLGSVEEAEDAAQEVFIKAYRKINGYKPGTSFSSWLYRIAYNHCVDLLRKRKFISYIPLCESAVNDSCNPIYSVENYEMAQILRKALSALSPEDRTVLMLRILEEKSYEEIADILGKRPAAIRKKYERAKKR